MLIIHPTPYHDHFQALKIFSIRGHFLPPGHFEGSKIQKKQCRIRTVTAPNFSQIGQKLRSGIAKSFPPPTIYLLPKFEANWLKNDKVIGWAPFLWWRHRKRRRGAAYPM